MSFFKNEKSWPLVPLKDIATLKRGYDLPTQSRKEGVIPIYASNGQNGQHNEAKIKGPGVITGRSGTIGKVHYTKNDFWPLNTALYVMNFHGNDPKWVFYLLQAFKLERFVEGAGVPTLNRNLVHGELIPLPPLEEQKRIATILDKADAIRQKRQQVITLADDFLRSVFLDMFGDPVTNPKGWELSTIGKLGNVITGSTPSSKKTGMFDGDIPFVTPGDLETDAPVSRTLTDEGALNSRTCRKGTTLVCCIGATIGKIGIASRKSAFNQQINAIEWGSAIDDEFGFFAMKLMKASVISSAIQTTLPILNKSAFSALTMYLPPKNLQVEFSRIYKSAYQLNCKNKKLAINSNMLFDSLLIKLFSGQL
ncbi:restriction endonuclease subunit S [Aeromonas veronii]